MAPSSRTFLASRNRGAYTARKVDPGLIRNKIIHSQLMSTGDEQQIDKMLSENPLVAFSVYTHSQVQTIRGLRGEITDVLDKSMTAGTLDAEGFQRVYALFWLWVLGAYEVTRTMVQAKSCFPEPLVEKIILFRKRISLLRMPFAKQEYPGNNKAPIQAEASVYGVDTSNMDFTFKVKGNVLSVRELLNEFESIFTSISIEDIHCDHRQSNKKSIS